MMARVLRRTLATIAAVALVLALAGPAAAAKPERVAVPQETFVISGFCDFDVLVEPLASKTYNTTFFDRDGNPTRDLGTGRLVVRMTNVDTGRSIELNISGPGTFVDGPAGLTVDTHGNWMLFIDGQLFTLSGHGQFFVDATSETIVFSRGHITDLCSILGG
jgi:hypothetical protein